MKGLTPKEKEIMTLMIQGYNAREAAQELGVHYTAAWKRLQSVKHKLRVVSLVQLGYEYAKYRCK